MKIVIEKDVEEIEFNRLARGTVFRIPDDSETFYIKISFVYNHSNRSNDNNDKYEMIYGAINLDDGSFHSFYPEGKVFPYYDAELVIK